MEEFKDMHENKVIGSSGAKKQDKSPKKAEDSTKKDYYMNNSKKEEPKKSEKNEGKSFESSSKKHDAKATNKDKKNNHEKSRAAIMGLSIATGVMTLGVIGLGIAVGITGAKQAEYQNHLENIYQKNFYDLVDSVNNTEIKMSKILASSSSPYQKKMLLEVANNANDAQGSIASLPLAQDHLSESVRMINQLSGYTKTLAEKAAQGATLTSAEMDTLEKLHNGVLQVKAQLNKMARKMQEGYSILNSSLHVNEEGNQFSAEISKIQSVDTEYPTLIYDGPFSDSVVNSKVKGLTGSKLSKDEVKNSIAKSFKHAVSIEFQQDTQGKFQTYNYRVKTSSDKSLYVQASQIGGHILTVSGASADNDNASLGMDDAQKLAIEFANLNGIEKVICVWADQIGNQGFFNLAPTQSGVVLYPDLVKVKIDLDSGTIVGYDSTSYFINHTSRSLTQAGKNIDDFRVKIPKSFEIKTERTVLAPLDYNREVLCFEFACEKDGDEYYFYINTSTGEEENILKVIKTDNGNKLM